MKRILSISIMLLSIVLVAKGESVKLSADTKDKIVEKVKEYCQLMQEFSGDVEKIENMDKIFAICENSNVSVINDLTTLSSRDISDNSMPLQQYMTMLTEKFENNVKTSHSGYKYLKTVVQPSPMKGFDATSYAFIKVDKYLTINGKKTKQRLNIIVNASTMKISSTISEDYEDPQRIYLEALEKFNNMDYEGATPLFEKVSVLQRFPGRYRAKTMLGWIYAEKKNFQKANYLLRESSQSDPLGGVILASKILMRDDIPVNYINNTEGVKILRELSNVRDKEIPIMHLIAASALVDATINLQTFTSKVELTNEDEKLLEEILISDSHSTDVFKMKGYWMRASNGINTEDISKLKGFLADALKADSLLLLANLDKQDFERWDVQISFVKMGLLQKIGDNDECMRVIQSMVYEKPHAAGCIAIVCFNMKQYAEALEWFKKAADYGDGFANYIVSLSYFPIDSIEGEVTYAGKYFEDLGRREILGIDRRIWQEFVRYLLIERNTERSVEEFLKWNQKAIDLGNVFAMEDRAFHEVEGNIPGLERNISHAITLSCIAACAGSRKRSEFLSSIHYRGLQIESPNKPSYEATDTYKTLRELDQQGNGAASYLLYEDYMYISEIKDSVQAMRYLERSKDSRFYNGMYDYAYNLLYEQNKLDQAKSLFLQLTDYPRSGAYGQLGYLEGMKENYSDAMYYFLWGAEKENDYLCYDGLSVLYQYGYGCKRNISRSLTLIKAAILYLRYNVNFSENSSEYRRLKEREANLESMIASESGADTTASPVAKLNDIIDASLGEDARIMLSESLLSEIFATPKAVVKTLGSNGKTIVSTETAEDFMLRLATMQTEKQVVEVSSKTDANKKYTELTVKME